MDELTPGYIYPRPEGIGIPDFQPIQDSIGIPNLTGQPEPDYTSLLPVNSFTPRQQAQIKLAGKIANAQENNNRLNDAIKAAQYPAIERDIAVSQSRQDSLLQQIQETRAKLEQPAPTLVQNQLTMPEMLTAGLGSLFNLGNSHNILNSMFDVSNQRNQLEFQNKLNQFNLTQDQLQNALKFMQSQLISEQGSEAQMSDLLRRSQIEDAQTLQRQDFQSSEAQKQRDFSEKENAWNQFYKSNTEAEVRTAAQRLRELDPTNAPSETALTEALNGASSRRRLDALTYYKSTVGRVIDGYQGLVPDKEAKALNDQIDAIAKMYDVPREIFGEVPSTAYWKRQYETSKLENRKTEVNNKLKFLQQKERDELAVKWANVDIARERAAIAQQNANTSQAKAEWQRVKGESVDITKKLKGPRDTAARNLAGVRNAIRSILKGKSRAEVANDYFKQKELKPLYKKEADYQGQIQYLDEQINTAKMSGHEADTAMNPPRPQQQSGPSSSPRIKPGETREYEGGIKITRTR